MKTALIVGSSGLIGSELMKLLIDENYYQKIILWNRKAISFSNQKIEEVIVDFEKLSELKVESYTDIYCCVGSTIKKAKTWENYRKIDLDIPVGLADIAEKYDGNSLIVISSLGANKNSSNKYLRLKGEMEFEVAKRKVKSISILRPSILFGNRKEFRFGEKIGIFVMKLFSSFMIGTLRKYRGVEARDVAKCAFFLAKTSNPGFSYVESEEIKKTLHFK